MHKTRCMHRLESSLFCWRLQVVHRHLTISKVIWRLQLVIWLLQLTTLSQGHVIYYDCYVWYGMVGKHWWYLRSEIRHPWRINIFRIRVNWGIIAYGGNIAHFCLDTSAVTHLTCDRCKPAHRIALRLSVSQDSVTTSCVLLIVYTQPHGRRVQRHCVSYVLKVCFARLMG